MKTSDKHTIKRFLKQPIGTRPQFVVDFSKAKKRKNKRSHLMLLRPIDTTTGRWERAYLRKLGGRVKFLSSPPKNIKIKMRCDQRIRKTFRFNLRLRLHVKAPPQVWQVKEILRREVSLRFFLLSLYSLSAREKMITH